MGLLLAEQLLLLALDDDSGRDSMASVGDTALAAALLLDLALQNAVGTADDGTLTPRELPAAAHPLLVEAYGRIPADRPSTAQERVARLAKDLAPLRDRVAAGLVGQGILAQERVRVLGVFHETRFPQADAEPERALRQRLTAVLTSGEVPSEQEALLIGLLDTLRLVDRAVPKALRRTARRTAAEIGRQGLAGTVVRDAVRQLQLAVITAAVIVPAGISPASGS